VARPSVWDDWNRNSRPVAQSTLPIIELADIDVEKEAREAQARVIERRTIRRGRDAWREINRAESFEGWRAIGAALAVGKRHALKVTGANAAWGRNYSREFSQWLKRHGFDAMGVQKVGRHAFWIGHQVAVDDLPALRRAGSRRYRSAQFPPPWVTRAPPATLVQVRHPARSFVRRKDDLQHAR
jgi:hypothetical protein